jgi:hypothetical protein
MAKQAFTTVFAPFFAEKTAQKFLRFLYFCCCLFFEVVVL